MNSVYILVSDRSIWAPGSSDPGYSSLGMIVPCQWYFVCVRGRGGGKGKEINDLLDLIYTRRLCVFTRLLAWHRSFFIPFLKMPMEDNWWSFHSPRRTFPLRQFTFLNLFMLELKKFMMITKVCSTADRIYLLRQKQQVTTKTITITAMTTKLQSYRGGKDLFPTAKLTWWHFWHFSPSSKH